MKTTMTTVLTDANNRPMTRPATAPVAGHPSPPEIPLTLRMIVQDVTSVHLKGDEALSGSQLYEIGELARRAAGDEAHWTLSEVEQIKERIVRGFPQPGIINAVWRLFDAARGAELSTSG